MNRAPLTLAAVLALLAAAPAFAAEPAKAPAAEKEAEDQSKERRASLADKIPPVSGNLFTKKGRFEVSPMLGMSLGDAFFQKYEFGLRLTYHVLESFSVGLHGSYNLATASGVVNVCRPDGCTNPKMEELNRVPGNIGLLAGLDLAWSPLYGKVNVAAEKVLHFDTAIVIGGGVIQYQAPAPRGTDTSASAPAVSEFTGGGHVGIVGRVFITPSVTLRVELRDYIYAAKVGLVEGTDENSKWTTSVQNQLMLELGVSFFIGSGSRD